MSGEISSKAKHAASNVLSKHELPAADYRGEALGSSLADHASHKALVPPTQDCERKLPLAQIVLKLLQEEKPFNNHR
jgi:hypothetical protein